MLSRQLKPSFHHLTFYIIFKTQNTIQKAESRFLKTISQKNVWSHYYLCTSTSIELSFISRKYWLAPHFVTCKKTRLFKLFSKYFNWNQNKIICYPFNVKKIRTFHGPGPWRRVPRKVATNAQMCNTQPLWQPSQTIIIFVAIEGLNMKLVLHYIVSKSKHLFELLLTGNLLIKHI